MPYSAQAGFDTSGYSKERKSDPYVYQVGFGNAFASQAIPGALPEGQNSPQNCKYDLYAEQLNGTPFTVPRAFNQRTWLYRILPSVAHGGMVDTKQNPLLVSDFSPLNPAVHVNPHQVSWKSFKPSETEKHDFIYGLRTLGGNGSAISRDGMAFHVYAINQSMEKTAFMNVDGDFLFVPEEGRLDIQTEMGSMMIGPGEIAVVQAGIKFKVAVPDGTAQGSIYEVYGTHYTLPELGPLGANGMANVRDFEHPVASFDTEPSEWKVVYKIGGKLFETIREYSPFDVVAWHGNYVPYKYDLYKFIIVQSSNIDHIDPSVFSVLVAKSKFPNINLMEFCAVHPFWVTTKNTFRPQYFHRNSASEFLAFIKGGSGGYLGYAGLVPHGTTVDVWEAATTEDQVPVITNQGALFTLTEPYQMILLTDYGVSCSEYAVPSVSAWNYRPNFLKRIPEINADLKAARLPPIRQQA
ncbi:homogentisate 1,2-dioxygenase [Cristinia sonorae]|uniref:homogentisate 1,2-dioxygenase n=1 Tax=Cristinia sonorae TaxID=1940300 RepID=A0A8K0ULD8_9AGAR|nr:homogentisate 1,2-dioxygenase [Cristinia sonorae]